MTARVLGIRKRRDISRRPCASALLGVPTAMGASSTAELREDSRRLCEACKGQCRQWTHSVNSFLGFTYEDCPECNGEGYQSKVTKL